MVLIAHFVDESFLANATMKWHVCLSCVLLQDMLGHLGLVDIFATVWASQYHMYSVHMVGQVLLTLELSITFFASEIS